MGSFNLLAQKRNVGKAENITSPYNPASAHKGLDLHVVNVPAFQLISRSKTTIPNFSGSNEGALVHDWLYESEQVATFRGWNDAQKLKEFVHRLKGKAREYHSEELASIGDYGVWRQAMVTKFYQKDKIYYLKLLGDVKQKPYQSVRVFAKEIDSLFVQALGLRFVTERSFYGLKLHMKMSTLISGLRDGVWAEIRSLICNRKRLPSWSRIVKAAQDAEWFIDLKKVKQSPWVDSDWDGQGYAKVYISVSAVTYQQRVAGYGVFFGKKDSKNVSETILSTCNVALIRAAIRAIKEAKDCGMTQLIIYTNAKYLLDFVDRWAITWLKQKWRRNGRPVLNVEEWCDLLAALENMDVKWANVPVKGKFAAEEARVLARNAMQRTARLH